MPKKPALGPWLKALYGDLGVPQTRVATKLKLSRAHVSKMLSGENPIPESHLAVLARLAGLTVADLVEGMSLDEMLKYAPSLVRAPTRLRRVLGLFLGASPTDQARVLSVLERELVPRA